MATGLLDKHIRKTDRLLERCWTLCNRGQLTADLANAFIWDSGPTDKVIVSIKAAASNVSGTNVTIDFLDDGVSKLTAPIDMKSAAEGSIIAGALATTAVETASKLSINIVCNTSTPELDNLVITIYYRTKAEDETE